MRSVPILRFVALMALLCVSTALQAQVTLQEIITPRTDVSASQTDPREKRVQAVKVRLDVLQNMTPGVVQRLSVRLFPDVRLTLELDDQQVLNGSASVWRGRVKGDDVSRVQLSLVAGTAIFQIETRQALYLVRPSAQGYLAIETQPRIGGHCAGTVESPGESDLTGTIGVPTGNFSIQDIEVVDVLGYYTTIAKNSLGGDAGMQNQVQLAINQANDIMSTSQVGVSLNLIEARELPGFAEINDYSAMLTSFRNNATVRARRDAVGADLVTLFVTNRQSNGTIGIAYLYSNSNNAELAYSITNYLDATTSATFAHEIGHNFGCDHNDSNAGSSSAPYARGWRNYEFPLYIRTVMAYDDALSPILCYTFSAASRQYRIALTDYRIGDANHDNSRRITETKANVAAYRTRSSYLSVVYVDKNSVLPLEVGNAAFPFKTLAKGVTAVVPFGTVYVAGPGQYNENLVLTKQMFLELWPGKPAPILGFP